MQHVPAAGGIAAVENFVPGRRLFKIRNHVAISRRAKLRGTGPKFADAEKLVESCRATDVVQVAVRQDQALDFVHALRAEKRFEREFDGAVIATIHQPVVFPPRRVHKHRMAAVERQNGQFDFVARSLPVPDITGNDENQTPPRSKSFVSGANSQPLKAPTSTA